MLATRLAVFLVALALGLLVGSIARAADRTFLRDEDHGIRLVWSASTGVVGHYEATTTRGNGTQTVWVLGPYPEAEFIEPYGAWWSVKVRAYPVAGDPAWTVSEESDASDSFRILPADLDGNGDGFINVADIPYLRQTVSIQRVNWFRSIYLKRVCPDGEVGVVCR